jgi:ABC-type molybdate transport system substrate-binding protein
MPALVVSGQADLFLVYCTIALAASRDEPSLVAVPLPEPLRVDARYGLTTLKGASPGGKAFAEFLLSADGQGVLESHGFLPPAP